MSAAATTAKPDAKSEEAPKKGKKKLIIIVALAVLLAGGGGGGYVYWSKKKAAEAAAAAAEEDDEDGEPSAKYTSKKDKAAAPTFMPMDMFTLNLADKGTERFLQLGVTLEVLNAKAADELKAYMPAIRNNVLMLVANKQSTDLHAEEGKRKLAKEIRAAALLPLGIEIEDEDDEARTSRDADDEKPNKKKKKKKKRAKPEYPVVAVHFSNFIIQ